MTIFHIFLFVFLLHLSKSQSEFGKLEVVSDLLPQDCFDLNMNYDSADGLPQCVDFGTTQNEVCTTYWGNTTYKDIISKPTCAKDGKFGPKQCKGDRRTGRCFCFSAEGKRVFGQQWWSKADNMTCACSRRKADMNDESIYFNSLHCNSMGNYETLQCDFVSEQCWCVEEMTGELTSPVVPEKAKFKLACYNSLTLGSQYLRQCESQKYAQSRIEYKLKLHGTNAKYADFVCDDDGSFGAYAIFDGATFCTWRDNTKIGTFQAGDDRSTVNCNCARDSKIFEEVGNVQNQKCDTQGNYVEYQKPGSVAYCVDLDGYKKSKAGDAVLNSENCTSYYAYH
ncbi:hypothetical protein MTP99_011270 [Tenebrio molitor]|jgi:hypothetical protein|nr:hypothetical protein MTP99_011270 [Tenebrio molitor]CAH1384568.1 unnamed protein product [Tenebrio molitor]